MELKKLEMTLRRVWICLSDRGGGGPDGIADFDSYGFFGDFGRNARLAQLGIRGDTKFQEQELEAYNEDTQEWKKAQAKYES